MEYSHSISLSQFGTLLLASGSLLCCGLAAAGAVNSPSTANVFQPAYSLGEGTWTQTLRLILVIYFVIRYFVSRELQRK